jgi:hypothetical protein
MVIAFICLLTSAATAQATIYGYTFIDYDEETNTVMAYSETELDYSLVGEYQAYVALTVTKSSGGVAASGSTYDTHGNGLAVIEREFAGEPDTTYTAIGNHRAKLDLWDYYEIFPYNAFYYDNW